MFLTNTMLEFYSFLEYPFVHTNWGSHQDQGALSFTEPCINSASLSSMKTFQFHECFLGAPNIVVALGG
jgi:hypothetical protein